MAVESWILRRGRSMLCTGLALALTACSPGGAPNSNGAMAGMMQDMPEGMMVEGMMGPGKMQDMPEGMMGEGMMGPEMMQDMRPIHGLLSNHQKIKRRVEDIPNGVRTITTSSDARVAQLIRTHVRQMKARYGRGQPIRMMDPVFRELFRSRHKASLEFEDVPGGIRVTHTSDDPQVVLLIRQHARRFVSEAAEEGMARAMRPTPLPGGYRPPAG